MMSTYVRWQQRQKEGQGEQEPLQRNCVRVRGMETHGSLPLPRSTSQSLPKLAPNVLDGGCEGGGGMCVCVCVASPFFSFFFLIFAASVCFFLLSFLPLVCVICSFPLFCFPI